MNYAAVILVAIGLFSVIYWYAGGRKFYIGPRVKAQLVGRESESTSTEALETDKVGEKGAYT